jgi:hypothetical protein
VGQIAITVNEKPTLIEVAPDTPLLWVLRDSLALTGTKVRLRHGTVRRMHSTPGWRVNSASNRRMSYGGITR